VVVWKKKRNERMEHLIAFTIARFLRVTNCVPLRGRHEVRVYFCRVLDGVHQLYKKRTDNTVSGTRQRGTLWDFGCDALFWRMALEL